MDWKLNSRISPFFSVCARPCICSSYSCFSIMFGPLRSAGFSSYELLTNDPSDDLASTNESFRTVRNNRVHCLLSNFFQQ